MKQRRRLPQIDWDELFQLQHEVHRISCAKQYRDIKSNVININVFFLSGHRMDTGNALGG